MPPPMASSALAMTSASEPGFPLATVLSAVCLVWYSFLWAVSLLGLYVARTRYASSSSPTPASAPTPGVTILRPLKGLDSNLYENLASSLVQEYPDFEVIFSVADEADPALAIVRLLMERFGDEESGGDSGEAENGSARQRRKIRVVVGDIDLGPNPKINNLVRPLAEASHDILWILDSGILLPSPLTLARSVAALLDDSRPGKRVGLVHHVPFAVLPGRGGGGVGSWLERAFLNTNHAKMYLAINKTEVDSCVMGKSNLYRASDLSRTHPRNNAATSDPTATGLSTFSPYLAEDNMIALSLMHHLSLRHAMPPDVACNAVGAMSFSDYFWRRVRWIRVRKQMTRMATLVEPFTESLFLGALAALSVGHLARSRTALAVFWLSHSAAWTAVDWSVMLCLQPEPLGGASEWMRFALAYAGREVLALPVWLVAMVGNTVVWRGRTYTVLRNGLAKEVQEQPEGSRGKSWWAWCGRDGREGAKEDRDGYRPVRTTSEDGDEA